ncbi:hypothetical protein ACQ4PT_067640 [Festuca glaucescens]
MANIQQQARPLMDHQLLKELINCNAYKSLEIVILNPGVPLANQNVTRMAVRTSNPEELLQGVTFDWDGVLHIAARSGDFKLVNAISKIYSNVVDVAAKNNRGETALHCAAATGNVTMISLVISLARDNDKKRELLGMRNLNGETCLHDAVRCGERGAVEKLVEEDVKVFVGPDEDLALVRMHDNNSVSPLYLATTLSKLEIVQFLTKDQVPVPAQAPGGVPVQSKYPAASYTGPGGKTALHAAVLICKDLSEYLANWTGKELIDKPDDSESTPLHLLASANNKFIMKLFLKIDESAGYHADKQGSLPIHIAAANGSREIVRLLSDRRPSCSWSCNKLGQTILHIAVKSGNSDVVDFLCSGDRFAQIFNTRDINGNTALHLAVLQGEQLIFCRLMQKKALCMSITNKMEQTPLDLAQLNLPRESSLLQTPRHWAMYALVLAGADYGTCPSDHLAPNVATSDKEKEAKSIGKSAGLVAVCSVLILTSAFAAPFSVTVFYKTPMKNITGAIAYRVFVMSDAMAFALSVIAISCSTLAGFSFTDRGTRLFYLGAGVGCLFLAALFTVLVFTAGVYLAAGSVIDIWTVVAVCLLGVVFQFIILPIAPAFRMLLHAKALLRRLGFRAWFRALFCLLPRQRRDRVRARYRGFCARGFTILFLIGIFCVGLFVAALESANRILQPALAAAPASG